MLSSKLEQQDQPSPMGTTFPSICERCAGSLTSSANHVTLKMQDGVYSFLSLSKHVYMDIHPPGFANLALCCSRSQPCRPVLYSLFCIS